jgi:hypothetical protein
MAQTVSQLLRLTASSTMVYWVITEGKILFKGRQNV